MSESSAAMTSHRPYLLRALWEWIADNGMTPHLLVDAGQPGVRVPPHTIKDGKVVLNIADRAVARLEMGNELVTFTARFAGVSHPVSVPIAAVLAIYARETGHGMALPEDIAGAASTTEEDAIGDEGLIADGEGAVSDEAQPPDDEAPPPRKGGHLRVVK